MIFFKQKSIYKYLFLYFYYFREMVECPCRVCQPLSRSSSSSTQQLGAAHAASQTVEGYKAIVGSETSMCSFRPNVSTARTE
jgi:hypothetical protein